MEVKLIVVGGKLAGKEIVIRGPEFVIGRGQECHLRPQSSAVSRKHCAIVVDEDAAAIEDFASTNGTFVNGERVEKRHELKNGDRLKIGALEFEVLLAISVAAKMKPKVHSVQEAAARTVASAASGESDLDISGWLEEGAPKEPAVWSVKPSAKADETVVGKGLHDTTAIPAPATQAAPKPKEKTPPKAAARHTPPPKPKAERSGAAANDVLKQFFARKK